MADTELQPRKLSTANTKNEMLAAYNELLQQLQEKREAELKPEERIEEKVMQQAVAVADSLSTEGIVQEVSTLKAETGRLLSQLADRLDAEVSKYDQIKKAVQAREKDLQEIYEIQRSASSLAALIEAQHQRRQAFEAEMASRREELSQEIESARAAWDEEKTRHAAEIKERDTAELKRREREKEEYLYTFEREQRLAKEQFQDERDRLEREIQNRKEQMERELALREAAVAGREEELADLRTTVSAFPKELETALSKAVKEAVERVQIEAKNREALLKIEFEGEKNVLNTRIVSLENTAKEQTDQIAKLSQQAERAHSQVQDIAVKAIEGTSHAQSFAGLQQLVAEQTRKQTAEGRL